jgi:hypothetical protein
MNEAFLHFVWKYKNFSPANLKTTDGLPVKIIKTGEHNFNAGPDFLNAQVLIDDTHWAGNVEMHLKTSDWQAHKHSEDPAYDNVILHVVYYNDMEKALPANRPLLVLADHISDHTLKNYDAIREQYKLIPCESLIGNVDDIIKKSWLDRMLTERLEAKSFYINKLLNQNKNDWAETAYQLTGRNFGFKVNADPFERLTRSITHRTLAKHKNSIHQIEAMLFGQAGFLQEAFTDNYPAALKKEYRFLAGKYNLNPGRKADWKFLRLRPGNFPTVRISQFAALIYKSEHLFSKILEVEDIKTALSFFSLQTNDYWKDHYTFETPAASKSSGELGKESKYNLIINTVAPLLFSYGHIKSEPKYKDTAIRLLEECPRELNTITKSSLNLGLMNDNACHSQGLIHLRHEYCLKQQCLACGIGAAVLKR